MPYDASTYDDDRELTTYIWHNYSQLFTPLEILACHVLLLQAKAKSSSSESMTRILRARAETSETPEVMAILADGTAAFRDQVSDRVMSDCAQQLFINRCAKCARVVTTPRAQQCLWCGHDWHKT